MSLHAAKAREPGAPHEDPRRPQPVAALAGAVVLLGGAFALGLGNAHAGVLFALGGLLGIVLYHAGFGFASAYRRAIAERDVSAVRAQVIMLGLAMLLFAPVLGQGEAFGRPVVGAVAPVALQVAAGSFIFGLGMQLGGACSSGTLYTVGGGSTRMLLALLAFCAGAFLGSLDLARWQALPSLGPVALSEHLGWPGAVALQLAVLAALWLALGRWARGRPQRPLGGGRLGARRLLAGPWPLLWGALLLAVLNWATLVVAGHPWTIVWGLTLWGAEAAAALGWDPSSSSFWSAAFAQEALRRGVLGDTTSLMDLGIIAGALTAAGLAGRFRPTARVPLRVALAALAGGLLMGYGARLAFGCNIGAFFSGVASTSLHGWLWIACALAGSWLGVGLRRRLRV